MIKNKKKIVEECRGCCGVTTNRVYLPPLCPNHPSTPTTVFFFLFGIYFKVNNFSVSKKKRRSDITNSLSNRIYGDHLFDLEQTEKRENRERERDRERERQRERKERHSTNNIKRKTMKWILLSGSVEIEIWSNSLSLLVIESRIIRNSTSLPT